MSAGRTLRARLRYGQDLLPEWVARLHGFRPSGARRALALAGMKGLAGTMRWALVNSAEAHARRRAAQLTQDAAPAAVSVLSDPRGTMPPRAYRSEIGGLAQGASAGGGGRGLGSVTSCSA